MYLGCLFCTNKCGHQHFRVCKVVYITKHKKSGQMRREFKIQNLERHFAQLHSLTKSAAETKLEREQKVLQQALVSAMADQPAGNYSMFERKSFAQFLKRYGDWCKNYREIPTFLNFHPRSIARQVTTYSRNLMDHFKKALNQALRKQTEQLRSGQTPKIRITVTCFMDHVVFKEMRKKVGCVSALTRISDQDGSNLYMSMPIDIWDVKEDVTITDLNGRKVSSSGGTTAKANAKRFYRAIKSMFEEDNRQFIGGTYDGAIYDKKKTEFVELLKNKYGLNLIDILSFTCQTHGHALKTKLSPGRCYKDLGLKYDGEDKAPDPERINPDVIWFGNEKGTYGSSFRTFNQISKLLASKAKKNKMSFAEYVHLLAFQDAKASKGEINPQRTNSPYIRWKNHYMSLNEDERQVPLKMIQENDKKLRRFYQKCYKMVDCIAYCKIAMKKKEFEGFFKNIPNGGEILPDYIHMVGQWAGLVELLWSINDSNRHGYDCSLIRSLMIVLKAATEATDHFSPLENILIR